MKPLFPSSLPVLSAMALMVIPGVDAAAQNVQPVETGVATGIFYAFYVGERDIDPIPVAYSKYEDGTIVLNHFVNGQSDLKLELGEPDEYNTYPASVADVEGVGYNDQFTYEGYEYWPFSIYRFESPVVIGPDQISFLFMDGTTYYDSASDTVVLDYTSAVDDEEYLFLVDFTMPMEDVPTAVTTVRTRTTSAAFDLAGRRIAQPQKGLVVVDGKKVFRK